MAIAGAATVELRISLAIPSPEPLTIVWEHFDGTAWRGFKDFGAYESATESFDGTVGLTRGGTIRLVTECGESARTEVNGIRSFWVRGRLCAPLPAGGRSPVIERLKISSSITRSGLVPDAAFADTLPVDLSRSFQPLGPVPQAGNVFAIASDDAFSKPGAKVTLSADDVAVPSDGISGTATVPSLAAEVWDGSRWVDTGKNSSWVHKFVDEGKTLSLTLGDSLEPTTLNRRTAHWLRLRVTDGAFAKTNTITVGGIPITLIQPVPPHLANLTVSYTYGSGAAVSPQACLTFSDFQWTDQTAAATSPGPGFPTFPPADDRTPALYLGFDKPLPADRIGLYLNVREAPGRLVGPLLRWEYVEGRQWLPLTVADETANLSRPGIVSFVWPKAPPPPEDLPTALLPRFGTPREWVRARLDSDGEPLRAQLDGVHLNGVWAAQVRTYENERLGSSNGQPRQAVFARNTPVLPGEVIEVRELSGPRAAVELPMLLEDVARSGRSGQDVRVVTDRVTGRVSEVWVRWQAKRNLHFSGPDDRDYVIERSRGRLVFGDGTHGRVPPPGADSIRAARYTAGGGAIGNVPANAITQLLSGVLAEKVTNPRDAEGGADTGSLADVRLLGPQVLRHRRQAVTPADYEALAREASPAVAVARALPTTGADGRPRPGWVTVVVVPHSGQPRPQPSFELRRQVQRFLAARVPATAATGIVVTGPEYLPVGVRAVLAPLEVDRAGPVRDDVLRALGRFLHPLTGGPLGDGWTFGRDVYLSDLARLIEATTGVDYVSELELIVDDHPQTEEVVVPADRIVVAGPLRVLMQASESER